MGRKSESKKRTKSQASPESSSALPDKRPAVRSTMDMSQQSPLSQPIIQSTPPCQQGYVPFYNQYNGYPQTPQPQTVSFQQSLLDRLGNIEQRLSKLDEIDNHLGGLSQKLATMDTRVLSLETTICDNNRKLIELEESRNFDSKVCEDIRKSQTRIENEITEGKVATDKLRQGFDMLQKKNESLSEEILELQTRSMKDNLLFFGIDECGTFEDRMQERCAEKIHDFCEKELGIPTAKGQIKIDRAHRIGKFMHGKKRPVVVKFNYFQDKMSVKKQAQEKLRDTPFRVSEQFPKTIQERRRSLIPHLIKAKQDGQRAVLNYDKLYVNGQLFNPGSVNSA